MSMSLENSQTRLNLMRGFAGESQARNRYTFAASLAKEKKLYVIEQLFTFTANQEQTHAKVYYNQLKSCSGQTIQVDGGYPVELFPEILPHLRSAQHNEYQEWEHDYASFATIAQEEGFPQLSYLFSAVAAVEKIHGDRFGTFADLLESGHLFTSNQEESWMCLHCGHVVQGTSAPAVCPLCSHPQGYFIRKEMTPFH